MTEQTPNPPQPEVIPNPGKEIAAPFVNQFYVSAVAGNVRITFGEYLYGLPDPQWRSAVVMPESVALQMALLIFELYQKSHPPQPNPLGATPPSRQLKSLIGDGF